jgi:dTDP-4-dehydrorhamnose 3,5-epimerase-like enzyme
MSSRLIELPAVVEGAVDVPFAIERVFYVYDVVAGATRGGHAHRSLEMVCVAARGAFTVALDDGREQRRMTLREPRVGLYIPTMVWADLVDFTSGAVAIVLCSQAYDESEYIRDHAAFRREVGAGP